MYPNISSNSLKYPNISKCIPMYPNVFECIRMYPNIFQCMPMYPNIFQWSQCIPSNRLKYSNIFQCIPMYPNISFNRLIAPADAALFRFGLGKAKKQQLEDRVSIFYCDLNLKIIYNILDIFSGTSRTKIDSSIKTDAWFFKPVRSPNVSFIQILWLHRIKLKIETVRFELN